MSKGIVLNTGYGCSAFLSCVRFPSVVPASVADLRVCDFKDNYSKAKEIIEEKK